MEVFFMNNTGTRRANGEGSIYDTIQKIKRPKSQVMNAKYVKIVLIDLYVIIELVLTNVKNVLNVRIL